MYPGNTSAGGLQDPEVAQGLGPGQRPECVWLARDLDVHFVVVEGIDLYLQIVLLRQASWRRRLRGALTPNSKPPVVLQSRAQARPVVPLGDE